MKTDNQMLVEQFNNTMFSDILWTILSFFVLLFVLWTLSTAWKGVKAIRKDIQGLHKQQNTNFVKELRKYQKTEKK